MSALAGLGERLRSEGGLLVECVAEPAPTSADSPARRALEGPRIRARADEYELLLESIYEGYLLHYGRPRLVRCSDADLGLLAGDHLYALGLSALAELGDIEAVAELADVISLCAVAHGGGDAALAEAVWQAGASALGESPSSEHAAAKRAAWAGEPGAAEGLLAAWAPGPAVPPG